MVKTIHTSIIFAIYYVFVSTVVHIYSTPWERFSSENSKNLVAMVTHTMVTRLK